MTLPTDPNATPLDRLAPAAREYRRGDVCLGHDLEKALRLEASVFPEAVILYACRILEMLAADAATRIVPDAGMQLHSNLELLRQYGVFTRSATHYWGHALRNLGNAARHAHRAMTAADAEFALLLLERWMAWYFCNFGLGPRLPALAIDALPLSLAQRPDLHARMAEFDRRDFNPIAFVNGHFYGDDFYVTPLLPAVLAEMLLDRDAGPDALKILEIAREKFPDDLRLGQLLALYWNRANSPEKAFQILAPLPVNDETVGIRAGAFKRLWKRDRNAAALEQAFQQYRSGWTESRQRNVYLGVNAAATALWLDERPLSRQLARDVIRVLDHREESVSHHAAPAGLTFDFWDQVGLAEAHLLAGELSSALWLYRWAVESHPEQTGRITVARRQAEDNLIALGLTAGAAQAFWRRSMVPDRTPRLKIGVTGHRTLPNREELAPRITGEVGTLCGGKRVPVLLSLLAEGADRLVAEQVLAPPLLGRLHIYLPMELESYVVDFREEGSLTEVQSLLDRADRIDFPVAGNVRKTLRRRESAHGVQPDASQRAMRDAAYEAAGRKMVNDCEVLLALWDGEPSRGRGGTADMVAYARQCGKPVVWIRPEPPYEVEKERMKKLEE